MSRGSSTAERKHSFYKVRLGLEMFSLGFGKCFSCVLFNLILFHSDVGKWDETEQNRMGQNCIAETEKVFVSPKCNLVFLNLVKMLGLHQ